MHAIPCAGPIDHDGGRRVYPLASAAARGARAHADARLAAALVARAPTAARHAWIELSPVVRAVLRRELGAGPDELDLCQEVFLRFFRRIDELRDPGALRGFIVGISLGVARNHRRHAGIRRCVSLTVTGELPPAAGIGVSFEAREALGRLQQVLAEADAEDRFLFLTRYLDQEPLDTIATMTGHRVGAVKGRLGRALHRLTASMRRDEALAPYAAALASGQSGRHLGHAPGGSLAKREATTCRAAGCSGGGGHPSATARESPWQMPSRT